MVSTRKLFVGGLASAIVAACMFAGCGPKAQNALSAQPNQFGSALFKLAAAANSPFAKIAKTITLTISASDMNTMTKSLTKTDSTVTGTITGIPAGKARTFKVDVFDSASVKQYTGSATADVVADDTVPVQIVVSRISGATTINGTVDEGGSTSDIVFVSNRSGSQQLWVVKSDGTSLTQLTSGSTSTKFCPRWSPDGSKIAYLDCTTGDGNGAGAKIFIINAAGSFADSFSVPSGAVGNQGLSWTPDGTHLLHTRVSSCSERIYSVNVTTKVDSLLISDPNSPVEHMADVNPTDANLVAYDRAVCSGNQWMKLFTKSNNSFTDIIPNNSAVSIATPRWNDSGTLICATEFTIAASTSRILTVKPDGTSKQYITASIQAGYQDFAEKNSKIVFSRSPGDASPVVAYNVWAVNIDGTNLTQLTSGNYLDTYLDAK
jgi:hypothetical protein